MLPRFFSASCSKAGLLLIACCGLFPTATTRADEKPAIDRLVPAGGQRGSSVEVKLSGKPGDLPLQVWSDRNELQFEIAEDKKTATVAIPADATPGVHRLRFWNDVGTTDLLPFVVGVIAEQQEVEPNNQPSDAMPVPNTSVLLNGVLEKSGDVDVYQMPCNAGTILVASVVANEQIGSPMDAVLQVLDASGTVIAQNDDDHNRDPQLAVPVTVDGPMFVRIFAFPSQPNSTIRFSGGASYVYRLTMTTDAFVDHTLPLHVHSDSSTPLQVHGWNLAETQRKLIVEPAESDTVTVADTFANSVSLPVVDVSVKARAGSEVESMTVPSIVGGCIDGPDQRQVFTFDGTKGQKLSLQVHARKFYSLLDPVVQIHGPDQKLIKELDDVSRDNLDAATDLALKADGAHTITVSDRYRSGSPRHFYAVELAESNPTFSATTSANAFVVKPAETEASASSEKTDDSKPSNNNDAGLKVEVQVARTGGLSETITFSAADLPAGITAAPVESLKEGDSAKKVTLVLQRTAEAAAFSGPIRIIGRTESGITQDVQAPIANSSDTTSQLWLTVVAPPKAEAPPEAEGETTSTEE